jgi:hypothetical protein
MREIALHLLDIAENSVAAGATRVEIEVSEDLALDRLKIVVQDNGRGMDEITAAQVVDPFYTNRTTRKVGLGLPLFKAAAEACKGWLRLTSKVGAGTRIEAEFQRSHIDRMPLGDLAATMLQLVIGHPEVNWGLHYAIGDRSFTFDDAPIKAELEGVPLTEPAVLGFMREMLEEGIKDVSRKEKHYASHQITR